MRGIERVPDYTSFGVGPAARLDLAHRETRRARRDNHIGRQKLIELTVQCSLEINSLRAIFLNEISALHRGGKIGRKRQFRGRRAAGEAKPLEDRPSRFDESLEASLRVWRDVGCHHLQPPRQKQRAPTRADCTGPDDGYPANWFECRHRPFSSCSDGYVAALRKAAVLRQSSRVRSLH